MGGHDHHHRVKIPDYRIYKVEDAPKLLQVQQKLAAIGLKDPWLRNEVWRYDPVLYVGTGHLNTKGIKKFVTRGFKPGVGLFIVSIVGEMIYKMVRNEDGGHHGPPPPPDSTTLSGKMIGTESNILSQIDKVEPNKIPEIINQDGLSASVSTGLSDKIKSEKYNLSSDDDDEVIVTEFSYIPTEHENKDAATLIDVNKESEETEEISLEDFDNEVATSLSDVDEESKETEDLENKIAATLINLNEKSKDTDDNSLQTVGNTVAVTLIDVGEESKGTAKISTEHFETDADSSATGESQSTVFVTETSGREQAVDNSESDSPMAEQRHEALSRESIDNLAETSFHGLRKHPEYTDSLQYTDRETRDTSTPGSEKSENNSINKEQ